MYTTSQNNLTVGGISVIVPVYNGEKYIKNCLDMLLDQDGDNFEVIVVNDGSTDKTADIVKSIHDEKLVYFEQENKGVSAARNKGIELSRGDWVVFCDADDTVKQGYIKDITEQITRFPDYNVFCYAYSRVKGEGNDSDLYDITGKQAILSTIGKDKSIFKYCNDYSVLCLTVWSKVYSKNFLIKNNLRFNSKIAYGEDVHLLFKLFTVVDKVKAVHRGYYIYNYNNENSTIHTVGRESEKEGYISFHLDLLDYIIKRDDKGLWKDDELIKAMNYFLINHANTCISRVLRAMMKNGRTVAEKRKALSEMKHARIELRKAVGKKFVFNINSIKVFIADNFPTAYIKLMEKRWKND